jgi:hypothetical protein
MTEKTAVFEISGSTGQRDLAELKNTKGIRILNEKEYFGIGGSEEGPITFIYRTVDYSEPCLGCLTDDKVYRQPL